MKKIRQRILASVLTGAMLLSMCGSAFAVEPNGGDPDGQPNSPDQLTVDDIQSIQAYTDETMYGTGVVEVEITYADGVDLPDTLSADDYILEDRGSLSPDFAQIDIDSVDIYGQRVTLTIGNHTAATERNALVYTGTSSDKGVRERNALGVYCTDAWYRDAAGTIYYGKEADVQAGYEANETGMGYQARACLELKLRHAGEAEEAALCLADDKGQYNKDGKWLPTIDRQFGKGKFQSFADLGIQVESTANNSAITDGTDDKYVRGYAYIPADYDPANGIVFTLQGQGISYWKLEDGTDDDGTGIMYDSATTSWANKGAIVVNIHDRSSAAQGQYWDYYDFVKDDVRVMKYFIDKYSITGSIVLQGNSRGTMASAMVIKALAGQSYHPQNQKMNGSEEETYSLNKDEFTFTVDSYICQNGTFGYQYDNEDWAAVAATGLRVWAFDGEQDSNNIDSIAKYTEMMAELKGEDWAAENVRLTGYPSELYAYWGESDHSTTRINGWYFDDAAFYGPDLWIDDNSEISYNTKLSDGDTYTLTGRGTAANGKQDYSYTVYDELYQEWALQAAEEEQPPVVSKPTPIESAKQADSSIGSYQRINGYYTWSVTVNGEPREIEVYIPEGARQREYWISMTLPNGVDSAEFLKNAGWFDIADETLACLLIMKPEDGTWGDVEAELAYVSAAMNTLASSGKYYSAFTYHYLVGYGQGAPALQLWAAQNPLKMISQVYLDSEADTNYQALLTAAGETQVGETPQPNHMDFVSDSRGGAYTDKDGNAVTQQRTFAAQQYKDIPIPTWFVGETADSLITYWKGVNDCLENAADDDTYGSIYWQDKANSDAIATSFSDVKTQVAVKEAEQVKMDDTTLTQNIYDFLTYYSGYDNNSVYGHFITERLQYTNKGTGNVLYRDHMWQGTNRTYIVYIPDSVKNSKEAAPLVVATHGAGQTAMVFLEATDIKEAADKYGFIAVTYDLTGDADYMVDLLDLVKADCKKAGVTVDESRIYAYGQSAGGGAVANTLAQSKQTVDLFAAFGITSGIHSVAQENGSDKIVPFYAIYGEYDYWPMKLGELEAGDWTGSQRTQYAWTTETQTYWANRLLGKTLDQLVDPSAYTVVSGITEDQIGSHKAPVSLIVNPTDTANRYKSYVWSDDFGGGEVPIFVWSQCYGRGHNLIPSDLNQLWENWFSKWQKSDASNTLLYYENGIESGGTPVTVKQTSLAAKTMKDIDQVESAGIDYTQSAQIPLEGWYQKTLSDGRTVKLYFPEYAACRAYFTVAAVDNNVTDVQAWADEQGYIDLMDQRGEVLVILEPGASGWDSLETELAYVTEAMAFVNAGKNAKDIALFTNYSTFYLVGYGQGAAGLEAWAAENPILVGSQAYVNGAGAGSAYLTEVGAKTYDGTNTGGYDPGIADEEEFKQVLKDHGYEGRLISRSEVPVPTWFVGTADTDSVTYWKSANDCVDNATSDGIYWQDINSNAFQTEYANSYLEDHGISQVKVSGDQTTVTAADLAGFLYGYSRYNVPFAYSNHLSERQDYASIRAAAQKTAQSGSYLTAGQKVEYSQPITSDAGTVYDSYYVLARELGKVGQGTVESGIVAFSDDNGDGRLDAREYLLYIPDSAKGKDAPIVFQFPGMTQSVAVGFDSTQWWRVANDEGVIVVILGEAYNNGVALSWKNSDMAYHAVRDILEKDSSIQIDWNRVYGSGHSLGSSQVQGFTRTHPEFFAAVASTSFASTTEGFYQPVPTMLVNGQSDLPFLMEDLWTASQMQTWFEYLAKANDLKVAQAAPDNANKTEEGTARTWTYTWNNTDEIPMVVWGETFLREHNCYPAEIPMAWDFLEHYSKDESGARTYSPSAFTASGDEQAIKSRVPDLDDVTDLQKDFSQAAQLPLTGYYTKTVSEGRTVKVYIAPEASIRSYFTVVAVPDGVDTYEFLQENGWFDLADEKGEGLFILEPGAGGWGSAQDEAGYLTAATSFLKSGSNDEKVTVFSTFGEFYLVGYGKGAAALELWAAANPILVISQTYVDGQSAGSDALTAVASTPYDGKSSNGDISDVLTETLGKVGIDGQIAPKDVPVPTYFINYTGSDSYWKAANDCVDQDVDGVYYQDIDSKAYQTEYANSKLKEAGAQYGISQVKVSSQSATPAQIYDWMSQYTRYDTTFAYSNAIAYRLDYTSARVAAQQDAKDGKVNETLSDGTQIWAQEDVVIDGHGTVQVGVVAFSDNSGDGKWDPREYMLYIPQGFQGKKLPVMIIFPGNTQTDSIFMDSTLWWQIAEEEGVALAFVCETYNANACSVSHADTDKFYNSLMTLLEEKIDGTYADLDFTRVYGSGQSAGSNASQGFAITNPEFFAAVASTSAGPNPGDDAAYRLIPSMMISGQMDAGDMAEGFDAAELQRWANYMLKANGFNSTFAAGTATSVTNVDSRHPELYTWSKTIRGVEVPLVQWAQCLLRPHNCYPSDMPMLWDFLEHFSFVKGSDGSLTRYYSASAFADNDAVVIDYIAGPSSGDDSDSGSSGGSSSAVSNSITVEKSKNGSVSVRPTKASQGATVTVTVTADDGYELDSLTVTDKNGRDVKLKAQGSGKYTFTMPAAAVTVDASFKAVQTSKPGLPFTDVSGTDWFYDAVVYAYESGLMSGTSASTFAPNQSLTRAMVAQVIYNLEGTPAVSGTLFSDVSAGQWYASAITWAAQNDLVSGYGNGRFGPNDLVTREQLAVILHHYAQFKKYSAASGSLASFSDRASASDWAVDSLAWAVGSGVMSGKGGSTLDPKGTATRAEVAQMFMNFLNN